MQEIWYDKEYSKMAGALFSTIRLFSPDHPAKYRRGVKYENWVGVKKTREGLYHSTCECVAAISLPFPSLSAAFILYDSGLPLDQFYGYMKKIYKYGDKGKDWHGKKTIFWVVFLLKILNRHINGQVPELNLPLLNL